MSARSARLAGALAAAVAALGGQCGGGSGSGGSGAVTFHNAAPLQNPDARCAALPRPFPPGFAFVPGLPARAVAASLGTTPTLVPFDLERVPPEIPSGVPILGIPPDSDGDGRPEGLPGGVSLVPVLDDVFAIDPGLGFATASGYEEVLFFQPASGMLLPVEVEVPASLRAGDRPFLPAPGSSALRTALSTLACVRVAPDALDSRGEPVAESVRVPCDPTAPSFRTSFTSGVALAAGHLFVSTSNLGADRATADTQYLPGSVLVFEFDRGADPPRVRPHPTTPIILTSGFNPTHVSAFSAGDRELVLVNVTGALGIEQDDPATKPVEGAGIPRSEAAIDVIDAATLELVATIPLGLAALAFDAPAIDPSGRVALFGSAADRVLYGVDLAALSALPEPPAPLRVLGRDEAVIFDAQLPFRIPGLSRGAPPESCPGETLGVAFDHRGERVYAGDFCDGTLASIAFDGSGQPDTAELRARFLLLELQPLVAPLRADTLGQPRGLGRIAVRPGVPGVDFQGPEVFFLVGQEEGLLCGISVAPR